MFNNTKRITLIVAITLISIISCSCRYKYTIDETDFLKLNAYISIPCLIDDYLIDYKVEILERDDFGRILYSVEVKTEYSDVDAVVIMQDHDDSSVMYYEDLSYYIGQSNEENTKALKENNDWNKEIKYNKTTKRNAYFAQNGDAFGVRFGVFPESKSCGETQNADKELKEALSADQISSYVKDYDEKDKWMMYCRAEIENKTVIVIAVYGNNHCKGYVILDLEEDIKSKIMQLKSDIGWNYNYVN